MKKIIIAILVFVILSVSFSSVLAKSNTETLFETKEITNNKILYNRAINEISDINITTEPLVSYIPSESGNPNELAYSIAYNTSQLLKIEIVDGEIIEHYATTQIKDVYLPNPEILNDNIRLNATNPSVRSSLPVENDDPSLSMRTYHTFYYSTGTGSDNYPYFNFWGARCEWEYLDDQVSFEGGSILARVQGYISPSGSWNYDSEYRSCASLGGTSFNTGFDPYRAILYAYMGSINTCTLKRGLSVWNWTSIATVTWNGGSISGITTN